uniref:DNA mismatch repair proteins mutS family domain-containing protein n=1 Tax=viral metagenome TaxID=1070528 RepID=A0A6C0EJP8_9ZZZZ
MTTITGDYLQYTEKHNQEYGKNIIVLLKVGAFYEMYGLKNANNQVVGSDVEIVCNFCDLQLSERSNMFHNKMPVLIAGFRDYCLDKYVEKITNNNYTCFVYDQFEENKKFYRKLTNIFSPGTYFNTNDNELQNITMVIWYELMNNNNIIFGISHINIITGQTYLCEYIEKYSKTPTILDNLERYLSIYNPCEIICITNLDIRENKNLINMLNIQTQNVRTIYLNNENIGNKLNLQAKNCSKQVYIKEVMQSVFQPHDYNSFIYDYLQYTYGLQAFTFLCNWISQHNEYLLDKISPPLLETSNETMQLANHSLTQLNIINNNKTKLSSLSSFLNNCLTPMGKREFVNILVHPITNIEKLNYEYDYCEYVVKNDSLIEVTRDHLKNMHDLEKLQRQIFLNKITPRNVNQIYKNVKSCLELWNHINEHNKELCMYFKNNATLHESCNKILHYISSSINMESLEKNEMLHENMFVSGYNTCLDELINKVDNSESLLNKFISCFQDIFIKSEKKDVTYVKLHTTDKMPPNIICTQKRSIVFKKYLEKNDSDICIIHDNNTIVMDNQFSYPKSTSGNVCIHHDKIQKNCETYFRKKQELIIQIEKTFHEFCTELKIFRNEMTDIVNFISQIDILQNKAYIAKKYNYVKPNIVSGDTSRIEVKGMRHALIEQINIDETYVKNDMYLNEHRNGMLLFGTNAVGKTSFMKALGIVIIMAQSGLYVPCDYVELVPYTKMFTRILNNDNMFKGLSTFAVEMSELRVILQNADENSIVLGDELCSGTEYESATSIFVSGIQWLHKKQCSFVFATHLHNITTFDEINELERLSMNHISVKYDNANDCLIYDRILKDGPGSSMYGLEVCKSLHLPMEFLDNAHDIRNKYMNNTDSLSMPKSSYNAKKIRNMCELCKTKQATEVHHLMHQCSANGDDFIGHIHKNNVANLASICEDCHQKIHHENVEMRRVKTTKGYVFSSLN